MRKFGEVYLEINEGVGDGQRILLRGRTFLGAAVRVIAAGRRRGAHGLRVRRRAADGGGGRGRRVVEINSDVTVGIEGGGAFGKLGLSGHFERR